MTQKVNLYSICCFSESDRLRELNRLVAIHTDLMPHQVAAATGCELKEAMEVLVLLYHLYLADAFTLVYHNEHPNTPAIALEVSKGVPPALPVICPLCEKEINDPNELSYGFLVKLNENVEFVVQPDDLVVAETNEPK